MSLRHDVKRAMHALLYETDAREVERKPLTVRLQIAFSELLRRPHRWRLSRRGRLVAHDWKERVSRFHRRMSSWRKRQGVVR